MGRTFCSDKTDSNAQAHRWTERGTLYFYKQRFVARFAEYPFAAWLRRSRRLIEYNKPQPDETRTDRAAGGFEPAPALLCCAPGSDRSIIAWQHHVTRPLSLPEFDKKDSSSFLVYVLLFYTTLFVSLWITPRCLRYQTEKAKHRWRCSQNAQSCKYLA